jgi:cell division protein FtsW
MRALPYTTPEQMAKSRRALVATMLALLGLGTVMVYSASFVKQLRRFGADSMSEPFQGHLLKVLVALVIFLVCLRVTPRRLFALAKPAWLVSVALLLLVLVAGTELNNSRRWFDVAGTSFQPSELARVATVLMAAAWMAAARDRVTELTQGVLVPFGFVAVAAALVFVEPDYGSSVYLLFMGVLVIWLGGAKTKHLMAVFAIALVVASLYGWQRFGHVQSRVNHFITPDPTSQVGYGLTSLSSGGVFGLGLGSGFGKWGLVAESDSDWILSVVGEELGLVGTAGLLVLYALFLWHGTRLLLGLRTRFSLIAGAGLLLQVVVQAVLNVAVVTALAPPKGLPLPFVSAGGTSLLVLCASTGLLLGLARAPEEDPVLEAPWAASLTHRGVPGS